MPRNKKAQAIDFRQLVIKAADIVGSQAELARRVHAELDPALGMVCTGRHVANWLYRDDRMSPYYAAAIERATGGVVRREDLCPGVFD